MTPSCAGTADPSRHWADRRVLPGGWVLPEDRDAVEAAQAACLRSSGPVNDTAADDVARAADSVADTVANTAGARADSAHDAAEDARDAAAGAAVNPAGRRDHSTGVPPLLRLPRPRAELEPAALPDDASVTRSDRAFSVYSFFVDPPEDSAEPAIVLIPSEPATTAERVLPLSPSFGPESDPDLSRMGDLRSPGVAPDARRSRWRRPMMLGGAAAVLALIATAAAGPTFGDSSRTVQLSVDGQLRSVSTEGTEVKDVLVAAGIDPGPRDLVAPSLSTTIDNGTEVVVRRARLVTVQIDGRSRQWWTTSTTLDQALLEMGVRAEDYQFAANRSRQIGLEGATIIGHQLRWVSVVDGRHATVRSRVALSTVQQVLTADGISLGRYDRVSPAVEATIRNGQQITVTRVEISRLTRTRSLPQPSAVTEQDPTLGKGNTVVASKGTTGLRTITLSRTVTNGSPKDKVLADVLTRQASAQVTKIGTMETGLPESWSVPWDKMAFCESTNRWHVDTGIDTYGGLQFKTPTWLEYGGGAFASRADRASKEQQIIIAERLYAKEGLAPWQCARFLGWGFGKYPG